MIRSLEARAAFDQIMTETLAKTVDQLGPALQV